MIVLTVKKSVTQFFQTKTFSPSLCNAYHYVSHYTFQLAQIAGSNITAADNLNRLELRVCREDPSKKPGRHKNNTNQGQNIFFGHR